MAKQMTERDRCLSYFHSAPQADIATLLETGRHIVTARFGSPAVDKPKRGRPPAKSKPASASAAVGDQGAG